MNMNVYNSGTIPLTDLFWGGGADYAWLYINLDLSGPLSLNKLFSGYLKKMKFANNILRFVKHFFSCDLAAISQIGKARKSLLNRCCKMSNESD